MAGRIVTLAVALAWASGAHACPTAYFAYFDFATGNTKYIGKENISYFVGRVIAFYDKTNPPYALVRVLKDYSGSQASRKLLRLPEVVSAKIPPFDRCTGPMLHDDMVGLFGYFEKEGEIWLAWQKGDF